MSFFLICLTAILVLGAVAAIASWGDTDDPVVQGDDCATCSSKADGTCKIACLMEEKKKREGNKQPPNSVK